MGCGGGTEAGETINVSVEDDGRWKHKTLVVNVGDFKEITMQVGADTTVEHVITHCEDRTGWTIDGLTSPHLLNEGRLWKRSDKIWHLRGPFESGFRFTAILEGWGFEENRLRYSLQHSAASDGAATDGTRWHHTEVLVHVGDLEDIMFPSDKDSTIEHVVVHCEDQTGREIEGFTSPHLLDEQREWNPWQRLCQLDGPFEDGIQLIALLDGWGWEEIRARHKL